MWGRGDNDFYKLYLKYQTDTLNAADSALVTTLANMCPGYDGMVVYGARSLYALLYGEVLALDDECVIDSSSSRHGGAGQDGTTPGVGNQQYQQQTYNLLPNPNDGNLHIVQRVADDQPVTIQVWNATGMKVYEIRTTFKGNQTAVHLDNSVPGMYMLQLTNSMGATFHYKFVIQ